MKKAGKKEVPCLICGKRSPDSICLACKARIQGEAIEKKQQRMREAEDAGKEEQSEWTLEPEEAVAVLDILFEVGALCIND